MDKFFNYYKTKTNKNTKINKDRKKNSGITLIALVVTIVLNCSCLAMERMNKFAKI